MANITYRQVADYMIPNLILPPEETTIRLGKWGMLYKEHLFKHNKVLFTTLLTQGKLYQHCAKIENQAQQMFEAIVNQMKEAEGVTEQLKEENQLEWVCWMQNKKKRTRDEIFKELPVEEVIHKADVTVCPECQSPMQTIGKEYVHEELVYVPAKMFRRKHYVEVVKCPECGEYTEKSTNDKTVIVAYSIINTAQANGIDVREYLTNIFRAGERRLPLKFE